MPAAPKGEATVGGPSASELAGLPSPAAKKRREAVSKQYTEADIKKDFRLFLILMWRHLGLPDPTPLQLSIAWYLQHGPKRKTIMAFRGAAKSWITAAYVLWLLYCNPRLRILVVSASLLRAVMFTQFCGSLLREWPMLSHLAPGPKDRQSTQMLDVRGATPDASASSIMARGIGGQLAGCRADHIVADDVEISTNTQTVIMRDKISEAVKEFDSVLKPDAHCTVNYLGTPHDTECLYNELHDKRGYTTRIWPALYPLPEDISHYGDKLAPIILDGLRGHPERAGTSTEPTRFTDENLAGRRLSLGNSEFRLQFLLDTALTDQDKYPLKLSELMVLPLDIKRGPRVCTWGHGEVKKHLPTMGMSGDYLHAPAWVGSETDPYTRIIAAADISGRGSDETCMVILAELHGMLYVLKVFASRDGYSPETLSRMATLCVQYGVQEFYHEGNFGDGMFGQLFSASLIKAWAMANAKRKPGDQGGTSMVEIKSSNQMRKEQRILSMLEPITQQHRIVVAEEVVLEDYASLREIEGEDTRHKYSLFWQYTHITHAKGGIPHDDRIETLAMACSPFAEAMGVDPGGMAVRAKEEQEVDELEAMLDEADEVAGRDAGGFSIRHGSRMKAAGPTPRS